ncbi:MAG: UbiA family prenyltransferase [Casimicrobium sp.]
MILFSNNAIRVMVGLIMAARLGWSLCAFVGIKLAGGSDAYAASVFLFLVASFLFNDLLDIKKDRLGASHKATMQNLVSANHLRAVLGFVIASSILPLPGLSSTEFVTLCIAYLVSAAYSAHLKRVAPLLATPLWCAAVVLVGTNVVGRSFGEFFYAFLFFYGRELLLDLRDVNVDGLYCKRRSLPCAIGSDRTILLSYLLVVAGILGVSIESVVSRPLLYMLLTTTSLAYAVSYRLEARMPHSYKHLSRMLVVVICTYYLNLGLA